MLACGEIAANDVVYCKKGEAGRVIAFWKLDDEEMVVELAAYACVGGRTTVRDTNHGTIIFMPISEVVDACPYYSQGEGVICLCIPPAVSYM